MINYKSRLSKIILTVVAVLTALFSIGTYADEISVSDEDRIQFLSDNPFFDFDINSNSLIGIYEGTTTAQFKDYYNLNVDVKFSQGNVEYTGTIKEKSDVVIRYENKEYITTIGPLVYNESPTVSTYSYNGTNFSLPLNKSNLLGNVSCGFGPYKNCNKNWTGHHNGIDFAYSGISGTSIYSVDSGSVVAVKSNCATTNSKNCGSGWGNYVRIKNSSNVSTLFAHMQYGSPTVSNGQSISKSKIIGKVGSSGNSNGYHLHFEVYISGSRVNPKPYLVGAELPGQGGSGDYNLISEVGTFTPNRVINIRNKPTTSSPVVDTYKTGESFKYDSYVITNGYGWLSYMSSSGVRRFVAYKVDGGEYYGSFKNVDSFTRVPQTGYRFYPNRTVNVRNHPSRGGSVVAQYYNGENFAYDSYVVNDGHIWLSYVAGNGSRRYVAWRVQNGEKFGVIK